MSLGRFPVIVADPPWVERGGGKIKRGADRHYSLLDTDAIIDLMRDELVWRVEPDAHLYLWVTNTFLPDGLRVMDALGFRYVSNVVWVKKQFGLGRYFRGQHEIALFGVMGNGMSVCTEAKNLPSVVLADHRRNEVGTRIHSGKPDEFYELVEARSKGPFFEMFSRRARDGWTMWGNQAPQVDDAEPEVPEALSFLREHGSEEA